MPPTFSLTQLTPTPYLTAAAKARFANGLVRFIFDSGFERASHPTVLLP